MEQLDLFAAPDLVTAQPSPPAYIAESGAICEHCGATYQPLPDDDMRDAIHSGTAAARIFEDMRNLGREELHVLTLNIKNRIIARHVIYRGTINGAQVRPAEVFAPAFSDSAASIILAHNHPSGDPRPSADDTRITTRLVELGNKLDMPVLDHIIIGDKAHGYASMQDLRAGF